MLSRYSINFYLVLFFFISFNAFAQDQCLDIFPGGEQEYGPQLDLPPFEDSSKNDGSHEGGNLALPAGDYEDVIVDEDGSIFFTELNGNYRMTKLEVGENATAQFVAGDYFIESLLLNEGSTLAVIGAGTVRIYANHIEIKEGVKINQANGLLIMISYSDIQAGEDLKFTGAMYAVNNISIEEGAEINGSITGESVEINDPVSIDYKQDKITDADFNGMCDVPSPTPIDYCETTFVNGATSFTSNGKIEYQNNPIIYNDRNGVLAAKELNPLGGNPSLICDGFGSCTSSGTPTQSLDLGSFVNSNDNTALTISSAVTLGTGNYNTDSFGNITIENGGNLNFSANYGTYYIKNLTVLDGEPNNSSATINLSPGDYYIKKIKTKLNTTFNIIGDGAVRIFIRDNSNFEGNTRVNISGAPENFLVYGFKNINIKNTSEFYGLIYSKTKAELKNSVKLTGAISANTVKLKNTSQIYYTCAAIPQVQPILNFRFDECSYSGVAGEVIDQIGNYSGQSFGSMDTNTGGQIARFSDISLEDHHIETSVPLPASYSVSTWFKKPISNSDSPYFALGAMQNGGDLLYVDRTNNWRWGIYNPNTGTSNGSFSFATLDNNWHHMALVYSGGGTQLYIDGVFTDSVNRAPAGTLKYIGTSFDDVNSNNPQGFRAPLDEFLVYDVALSAADILSIYDNQLAGNNYDASVRAPVSCSTLLAFYQFEQADISAQINDSSGLNNHAEVPFIGASMAEGKYCRGFDSVSFNRFDYTGTAFRSELDLDEDVGLRGTISFWFNSTIDWNTDFERVLFDASAGSNATDKYFVLEIQQDGRLKFAFEDSADTDFNLVESSTNNRTADTWYYLTVTWDYLANDFAIYVDGTLQNQQSRNTNGAMGELNQIVFGDNASNYTQTGNSNIASPYSSRGNYDEVRVYNSVLTAIEIQADMNQSFGCNVIDHFEINTLNAQGLTCEADQIIIRACADASCSTVNPDAVDVKLFINNIENKTVTVSGVNGTSTSYSHTSVGNAELSLDQTYECINGSPTDCDVTFADAGFRFISTAGTSLPIQLAGKPSNIGFNADILKVEAVKTDNSGACAPLLVTGESIDMAATYQSPISGTQAVNIAGQNIGTAVSGTAFDSLPFTSVLLNFGSDTQNSAEYIFNYPDAGSVVLNARYELPDDDGNPSGNFIKGTSNSIVVRPFAFDMFIETNLDDSDLGYKVNPATTSATGDIFTVAGQSLLITYRAVAWKAGDDTDANGMPDEDEISASNVTTTNYTNEILTSLNYNEVAPIGGITDALDILDTTAQFINGTKTDKISYDEVGIVSLTARRNKYLLIDGVDIEGYAPYVGRFIPNNFKVTQLIDGDIWAYCNSSVMQTESIPFAYSGQMLVNDSSSGALVYEVTPGFIIEARNKKDELTQNYIDTFFKLTDASFTRLTLQYANNNPILAPIEDATTPGKDPLTKVRLTANLGDGSFDDDKGVITYSYHNNDNYIYAHESNSEVIEFPADIDLSMVSIIDGDTVVTQDEDNDVSNGIFTLNPTAPKIRFGRAQLENSYGPDTSDLPQTLSINYFTANGYVLSATDTSTLYNSTNIALTNIDLGESKTAVKTLVDGKFTDELPFGETRSIILTAPTTGPTDINIGQVEVIYTISEWLQYDWAYETEGVDGLFNDNPRAVATFGIYRGNDRIIYQREIEK